MNTGYTIFLQGEPAYFIFIITPTSMIYSHINEVLFTERLKMFSLIAGTTAAVLVLIILLIKWNNILNKEVKRRTEQLEETNKQLSLSNQELALANQQLQVHDKMQREFINIASHELKTPTQAILGFSHLLQTHPEKNEEIIQRIKRNAARLQRLTNDILDVTRIESQTLKLNKERLFHNEAMSRLFSRKGISVPIIGKDACPFMHTKFTKNDWREKCLLKFVNRIGVYVTYVILQAMNPELNAERQSLSFKERDDLAKKWSSNSIFGDFILWQFANLPELNNNEMEKPFLS